MQVDHGQLSPEGSPGGIGLASQQQTPATGRELAKEGPCAEHASRGADPLADPLANPLADAFAEPRQRSEGPAREDNTLRTPPGRGQGAPARPAPRGPRAAELAAGGADPDESRPVPAARPNDSAGEVPSEDQGGYGVPFAFGGPCPAGQDLRLKRPLKGNRSGGPRTSEGRARSSLNAIKHGGYVTAKSASLAYLSLRDELTVRICPVGAAEEGVVDSLALELYRLTMLGRLEVERVLAASAAEVNLIELAQALSFPWTRTHLEALRSPPSAAALGDRLLDFFEGHLQELEGQKCAGLSQADQIAVDAVGRFIDDLGTERLEGGQEPDYLESLDRHMLSLGTGHAMLAASMALAVDVQHLVDYWLLRNSQRIEATRRELQRAQMVRILTDQNVGRARELAHRHVQQCIELLEMLQARPVDLGGRRIGRDQG